MAAPLPLGSLLVFLGVVGFTRGFLEALWLYAMAHRPDLLLQMIQDPLSALLGMAPFVAANVMTAYLRWAMYTFLFVAVAYWFGQRARFSHLAILAGLMLALYAVPVLVNVLYLFFPLPGLRFSVSQVYQPIIGVGQWVATAWFAWVAFHVFRSACGLSRKEALLGALFIPLVDRALFIGGTAVVFRWQWIASLSASARIQWVTLGFIIAAVAAVPFLLAMGKRLSRQGETP